MFINWTFRISVDGNFTDWTPWSLCSKTCGLGQIHRTRKCENPLPQFGGKFCVGNDSEARTCNMGPCCEFFVVDIISLSLGEDS